MMNSSDGKKSKRRKSKKCCEAQGSLAMTSPNKIALSTNISPKLNAEGNSDATSEGLYNNSEMASKVEQLIENVNDSLPCVTIPQGSYPYLWGNKCLVCQKDKTSEVTASSSDTCDHLDTFPLGHFSRLSLWICSECRCCIEDDHNKKSGHIASQVGNASLQDQSLDSVLSSMNLSINNVACCCKMCHEKREQDGGHERDLLHLHQSWMELRWAVRQVYQDEGLGITDAKENENVASVDNLEEVVHRLCVWDSHQLFLWLESYARELVIEIKLNLLKYLGNGFKSSQQAKLFVAFLLDCYSKLCSACKKLRPILKELEHGHLKKFNLNWELVIRHLFQSIIYGDHRIQNALPSITQLRLIRSSDENVQKQLTALLQKYIQFNEEMMIVAVIWREAEPLIQDFNRDLASFKSTRRVHRDDWDLAKKFQHKVIDSDVKADFALPSVMKSRCKCEDCAKKTYGHSGFHLSSNSPSPPSADTILTDNTLGGFCASMNFANSLPDSLDGISYDSLQSSLSFRECKDQCVVGSVLQNVHSEGLKSLLDDDLWMCNLTKDCPSCQCLRESVAAKNGTDDSKESLHSNKNDSNDVNAAKSDGCGQSNVPGVHSCQCHLNNLTPVSVSNNSCSGNSTIVSVDLPAVDLPCECHACVQNSDSATFPAIFNVLPPRPAALQLYPHIHGPNTSGHISHNTAVHSLKPFLNSHLNGIHLPSVSPRLKLGSSDHHDSSVITTHPLVQDHLPLFHSYTDYENYCDSSKLLLNSRKYGDFFPPPVHRHHHYHHHSHQSSATGENNENVSGQNDMLVSTNGIASSLGASLSGSIPLPSVSSTSETHSAVNRGNTVSLGMPTSTHLNKVTQMVASNSGCIQQLPSAGHCSHGCRHAKQHSCDSSLSGIDDVGNDCSEVDSSTVPARNCGCISVVPGKMSTTQYHSCNAPNMHLPQQCCGPASKRLCDGIAEPYNNLSSAQSPPNSSSLCSSQDVDNFPCDLEESVDDSCSEQSSSTSMSNQKDGKHCDCCYCEVFGHDVATLAPVSRNYPEMRDKLRLRLNKKKMECMNEANGLMGKKDSLIEDRRNLDDLISFINGGREESHELNGYCVGNGNKLSNSKGIKKPAKKQKKTDIKGKEEHTKKCNSRSEDERSLPKTHQSMMQDRYVSVIKEVPKMYHDKELTEKAMDVKFATSSSPTLLADSKTKNGSIPKKDATVETKPVVKVKKVKNNNVETNSLQVSTPTKDTKSQDFCNRSEVLVNGASVILEKNSQKKRKASLPITSTSSSNGSSFSSTAIGSRDLQAQRPARATNHVHQHVVSTSPSPVRSKNNDCGRALSTERTKGSSPKSTVIDKSLAKSQTRCSSSRQSQTSSIMNGMEKLLEKQVSSTKGSKDLLSRNGIRNVAIEDLIVPGSKNNQPVEVRQKAAESIKSRTVAALTQNGKNEVLNTTSNKKSVISTRNEQQPALKANTKSRRGKKQQNAPSVPSGIDDVFVPRDIDLDNGDLDETERELEAFKRFCWNSVPVANKEKVQVNLKEIVRKKTHADVHTNQQKFPSRASILVTTS